MSSNLPEKSDTGMMVVILKWRDRLYLGTIRPFYQSANSPVIVTAVSTSQTNILHHMGIYPIIHVAHDVLFHFDNVHATHVLSFDGQMLGRLNAADTQMMINLHHTDPNVWQDILPKLEVIA